MEIIFLLIMFFIATKVIKDQKFMNTSNRKIIIITSVLVMLLVLNNNHNINIYKIDSNDSTKYVIFMAIIVGFFVFKDDIIENMSTSCTVDKAWYAMRDVPACANIVPSGDNNYFKFQKKAQDGGVSKYITNKGDYKNCLSWLNKTQGCNFTPITQKSESLNDPVYSPVPDEWHMFSKYKKKKCKEKIKGKWCEADKMCYTPNNWPGNATCIPEESRKYSKKRSIHVESSDSPAQDVQNTVIQTQSTIKKNNKCDVFTYGPKGSKWKRVNPSQAKCVPKGNSFKTGNKTYPSCKTFMERANNYTSDKCFNNQDDNCHQEELNDYLTQSKDTICLNKA